MEIGGGLNFERKQFLQLVDVMVAGEIACVVLAHQDRLARFGYKLLAYLCRTHQCELVVMNTETLSPEQELVQDLITSTTVSVHACTACGTTAKHYRKPSLMIKAHKIRLHPTSEQANYFARAAGTTRFTFNWARAEWQRQYEAGGKPNVKALKKHFNAIRREQFPWTYEVTKCAVEGAFMDVATAFKNFFEGRGVGRKTGYPQFKSKKRSRQSFYTGQ